MLMPLGATPCPSQASLPSLRELDMEGCAVAEEDAYRETVFEMLPQIKYLDGVDGDGEEKDEEEEDEEEEDDDDEEEADEDVDSLLDEEGSELGGDSELGEEAQHISPHTSSHLLTSPHISPSLRRSCAHKPNSHPHISLRARSPSPALATFGPPPPYTHIDHRRPLRSHLSSQRAVCVQGADESDLGEGESELGEEEGEEGESELGDEEGEEGVSEADGEEDGGSDAGEGSAKRQRR